MPWARPSLTTLVTRVEADITSRLTGGTALLRRSILSILARVFAGAIHILHGYLEFIALQLFIDTAESDYLDRQAVTWGVPRASASFATGELLLTGMTGTLIPAGTLFLREDGVEFTTDAVATITGGSVAVAVTCKTAGDTGNSDSGLSFQIETPLLGLNDSATVMSLGIVGGVGQETDQALRVRILARIKNPPAGGSAADYIAWAKSISGVAGAWVFANYHGLGTVSVVITASGSNPVPSAPLILEVQNYIDTVRPVTAAVTVETIVQRQVGFDISIKENTSELRGAITLALVALFSSDAAPGEDFLISHLHEAILTSGLQDFRVTQIYVEGVPVALGNILFTGFEYPVLGVVTFSTLF